MKSGPLTGRPAPRREAAPAAAPFQELAARALYCPRCAAAMPVRERLLLVLPDGEVHEYLCRRCGGSLGTRTVKGGLARP
jgi:hypothetical protein